MAFRPPRQLPFRLRTRSTFCFARQRLPAGIYYRPGFLGIRHYGRNTSTPVVHDDAVLDEIRASAGSTPDVNTPFHPRLPGARADDTANLALDRDFRSSLNAFGEDLVHSDTGSMDRKLSERQMPPKPRQLLMGPERLREWRLTCSAIYKMRLRDLARQDERITPIRSLEFTEEDKALLETSTTGCEVDKALLETLETGCEETFRDAWSALGMLAKESQWRRLSLWLLHHSPRLLPNFLRDTCRDHWKPALVAVSDCIRFLSKFYPDLVDRQLVEECLHPDTWPASLLPQKAVRIYISKTNREGLHHAWQLAGEKDLPLVNYTRLSFMKRFTDYGDIDKALEALQRVQQSIPVPDINFHAKSDIAFHSEPVTHHCCKLLMLDYVVESGGERNFYILPKLLELGVKPTREMLNIVLANAYKFGDSLVAQGIMNYMKEQGMEFDSYTYLASLTGAVRLGDSELFSCLLSEIGRKVDLQQNPWILSKILHSHFVSTAKQRDFDENPRAVFSSMLDIYVRVHDITPLKELSIVPSNYTPPPGSLGTPPSVVALYIMIATYLRFWKTTTNVERLYHRFRYHVLQGHRAIAPLVATDHTMNEFLVAFRNDPRGLRCAVRLVEDMQNAHSETGFASAFAQTQFEHAPPSVRTWTLLMSCFVFNKEPLAAERVKIMMKKRGVEFSIATWNMIINNYANSQNIPALAETIKEMEDNGIVADNYTINSLRYLRDPERLWVAVDELSSAPKGSRGTEEDHAVEENSEDWLLDQGLQRMKEKVKA